LGFASEEQLDLLKKNCLDKFQWRPPKREHAQPSVWRRASIFACHSSAIPFAFVRRMQLPVAILILLLRNAMWL
jgi:hypothetical protein